MGYFKVRYDSRVVIYERKMFIRLATGRADIKKIVLNTDVCFDLRSQHCQKLFFVFAVSFLSFL